MLNTNKALTVELRLSVQQLCDYFQRYMEMYAIVIDREILFFFPAKRRSMNIQTRILHYYTHRRCSGCVQARSISANLSRETIPSSESDTFELSLRKTGMKVQTAHSTTPSPHAPALYAIGVFGTTCALGQRLHSEIDSAFFVGPQTTYVMLDGSILLNILSRRYSTTSLRDYVLME